MNIPRWQAEEFVRRLEERRRQWIPPEVRQTVQRILEEVRREGDRALARWTELLDGYRLPEGKWYFDRKELQAAYERLDPADRRALETMSERIRAFHRRQVPDPGGFTMTDSAGNVLGQRLRPLKRVGVYVPGGRAAYPSSVLMGLIPAVLAGVTERYVATPPSADGISDPVLAAAFLAEATCLFPLGGAQAIGALACGTETVPAVDLIVGPGNLYVTEAKRQVFGYVAIDGLAGPTEIVVVADERANPDWVAADLLAQAEHDPQAIAVLLTWSKPLMDAVEEAMVRRIDTEPRREIIRQAVEHHGGMVFCRDREEALELANRMAPEHLSVQTADPLPWLDRVESAGAVFLGGYSPVAAGDYAAGTNHILPTAGTGRFASGIGVETFLRRFHFFAGTEQGVAAWLPAAERVAVLEGFAAHASSLRARRKGGDI